MTNKLDDEGSFDSLFAIHVLHLSNIPSTCNHYQGGQLLTKCMRTCDSLGGYVLTVLMSGPGASVGLSEGTGCCGGCLD